MSKPIDERRCNRRFPLKLELSYRLLGYNAMVKGAGITHNIGSRGLLIQADQRLQPYDELELIIRWPILLDDTARLNLVVWGRVIRNDARGCAISVHGHEFRTRASDPVSRAAATVEKAMTARVSAGALFGLSAAREKAAGADETIRVA